MKRFKVSGVVSGFEAIDIMSTIYILVKFYESGKFEVVNNYKSVVSENGTCILPEPDSRNFLSSSRSSRL